MRQNNTSKMLVNMIDNNENTPYSDLILRVTWITIKHKNCKQFGNK